ncbi:GNAT family N-acetyltransferase [Massilia sp. CF038]|uniref:GNAT family N-acetyltransferase n=1 Tax=Massilia sp. CF038 TaxID=1881045 RepID=UPI000916520E|nr:GNAT family protein [Massilia sp. CF038]SHG66608.1 ribosomal-protein-alanine N-acetyltransferase [Massilia sp. CF038]
MTTIRIRTLTRDDAPALYTFEMANRKWFEQHIDARGDAFYTQDAVRRHVGELVDAHTRGQWHACVLADENGTIVGRANLKEIDIVAGRAEVGYRIAGTHIGRGLATMALRHLIDLARDQWKLHTLTGVATEQNAASFKVLEKCGFRLLVPLPGVAVVLGTPVNGRVYELAIAGYVKPTK